MIRATIVCWFSIWAHLALAQYVGPEIIAPAGDHFQTADLQLNYTLGEILIADQRHQNASIGQGFHRGTSGDAIPTSSFISQFESPLILFPNPATDVLYVLETPLPSLQYSIANSLYLIDKDLLWQEGDPIPIEHLAPGYYWITFRDGANRMNCQPFVKLK